MGGIRLHKELGVNPRLTVCPQCGGDGPELLLLGATNKIYRCAECNTPHVGRPKGGKCQKCGHCHVPFERELTSMERLPGSICDKCSELNERCAEMVRAGGIHWQCADCGSAGAIKAEHPLAIHVREQTGIAAPDPVGLEFTKEPQNGLSCPACGSDAVEG